MVNAASDRVILVKLNVSFRLIANSLRCFLRDVGTAGNSLQFLTILFKIPFGKVRIKGRRKKSGQGSAQVVLAPRENV